MRTRRGLESSDKDRPSEVVELHRTKQRMIDQNIHSHTADTHTHTRTCDMCCVIICAHTTITIGVLGTLSPRFSKV